MASKYELIAPDGDRRLIRKDEQGRIKSADDLGESLAPLAKKRATKTVKPGGRDRSKDRNAEPLIPRV